MKLRLLRNATMRLQYAGSLILTDPYLAPEGSLPSFTGRARNPMAPLPWSPADIVAGVELVIVSHLHTDHFDQVARQQLPPRVPILCQPGDEQAIRSFGFDTVSAVEGQATWGDITVTRVPARHGSSERILAAMGRTSGFVLHAEHEPTVYWAGDTVLYSDVRHTIQTWKPGVIILHASGAVWGPGELIVMNAADVVDVCRAAPESTVIAVHMDALDHGTVTRADVRHAARDAGIPDAKLRIPDDGEQLLIAT